MKIAGSMSTDSRRAALMRFCLFTCLLGGLVACGRSPATTPHKLSSGRTIRVLSVGTMNFQDSGPALMLSYQTDLRLDDMPALRNEVVEVWADFQKDATNANVGSAVIMANEIPAGRIIQSGKAYNFVFTRNPDGTWPTEPLKQ